MIFWKNYALPPKAYKSQKNLSLREPCYISTLMTIFETPLQILRPISSQFSARGARTFGDAAALTASLPYGRNSDRTDPHLVLIENRGTCSTKHALLALLAEELELDVQLTLGIYEMDGGNTPGVENVLVAAGLSAVPEAHCYLRASDERIDVTRNVSSDKSPFAALLYEEAIIPAQIGDYKAKMHRDFVRSWAEKRGLDAELVWNVREQCIVNLR